MKTIYLTAASLDGFIADNKNSLDWLLQFGSGEDETVTEFLKGVGALAMGSTTYEWIVDYLTERKEPWMYEQPAWVFTTRRLPEFPGADVRFVTGDVRPAHEQMTAAAKGRNVWLVGGGELVGKFYDAGLLDEMTVTVTSVTLGAGAPLLPRRIVAPPMRLMAVKQRGDSSVDLHYQVPSFRGAV
jgi:dihydrofolate reductase